MKKPIADIRSDATDASKELTAQTRTLALGVLAVAWLGLSGSEDVQALNITADWKLALVAALCIGALFLDLLQFVAGYRLTVSTLRVLEKQKAPEGAYNTKRWAYRLRSAFFISKVALVAAAAALLLFALAGPILTAVRGGPRKPAATAPTAKPVPAVHPKPLPQTDHRHMNAR